MRVWSIVEEEWSSRCFHFSVHARVPLELNAALATLLNSTTTKKMNEREGAGPERETGGVEHLPIPTRQCIHCTLLAHRM